MRDQAGSMTDFILGALLGTLGVSLERWTAGVDPRRRLLMQVFLFTSVLAVPVLGLAALEAAGVIEFPYGAGDSLLGLTAAVVVIVGGGWALLGWPYYLVEAVRFRRERRLLGPVLVFLAAELAGLAVLLERGGAAVELIALVLYGIYAVAAGWAAMGEILALRVVEER